ncbi:UNC93-like protein 1 [Papaver somniferum]|uniref:UNC93-like protein 1 n=1 Tax=Papaver somniferum TaxID=3469 RepID=UPI000E700038|nr:UNC93-like protein 1 [Papaver somniferum]
MDGAGFYMSGGGVDIAGGGDSGIVGAVVLIFQILVDTRHHSAQFITGKGKNIGAIMTSYPPRDGKGPCTAIFWSIFNIGGTIERRLFQLLMGDIEEAALRLLWAIIYPFSC